ncbi:MAG TPA: DUF2520 domain-containing protein [Nocardioidaceae bacterium]|nr:DUF2520 domain-containing protein [Nocardioidaceae bacterium]
MTSPSLTIGAIGAGRVGAPLSAALRAAGRDIVAVAAESDASRTRIATLLPGVPVAKPTAVARSCELLLVAVPDDALANVVSMLAASGALHAGQFVVHTSGRHGVAVLGPAEAVGARGLAMHPAMTFTGTDVDLDRLAGCVLGVTCAVEDRWLASALAADLRARVAWIPEEQRGVYHAALAHGANHLVTLVAQVMDLLRDAGSDDPSAVLRPLLSAALDNVLTYGDAALTGPIVRGDVETVRAHLGTLAATSRETLETYVALARATSVRAVADGRLDRRRAAAIQDALDVAVAGLPA